MERYSEEDLLGFTGLRGWLYSMVIRQEKYESGLRRNASELLKHMLYLHYACQFGSDAYVYWRNEIYNNLLPHELLVYKGRHRFPKATMLKDNIYRCLSDSPALKDSFKNRLIDKKISPIKDIDSSYDMVMATIERTLGDICDYLAIHHELSRDAYSDIMEKHGY